MRDFPEGRIGGLVIQLRNRGRYAEKRSYLVLTALIFTIITGLVFYFGLPFFKLYADSRGQTLEQTIAAIDGESRRLNKLLLEQTELTRDALKQSANTVASGTDQSLWHHFETRDGSLILYGEGGAITRSTNNGASFDPVAKGISQSLNGKYLSDINGL